MVADVRGQCPPPKKKLKQKANEKKKQKKTRGSIPGSDDFFSGRMGTLFT